MPKRLLDRCQSDSIREFRAAARQRYNDALALAIAGRRTGAVYLWGYAAEMTLKAAYFSLLGLTETDIISWNGHLQPAMNRGRAQGIYWPVAGQGHNVRAWAELLIDERTRLNRAFAPPFGREVQSHGKRFELLWKETLRYRKNRAYPHEVKKIREAAEWFLVHSLFL